MHDLVPGPDEVRKLSKRFLKKAITDIKKGEYWHVRVFLYWLTFFESGPG